MNKQQLGKQLEYLITQIKWPDDSPLVRLAQVVPVDNLGVLDDNLPPFAAIRFMNSQIINRDIQEEIDYQIDIDLLFQCDGDKTGRAAILGKDRGVGARGRGLAEAEPIFLASIASLTAANGVKFSLTGTGFTGITPLASGVNAVFSTYSFSAFGTQAYTYEGPRHFRKTGSPATLSWILPGDRFDLAKIRLRRKTGTKFTSISEGSEIPLATDLETLTYADAPAPGTYWYGLFAGYDELNTEDPLNYVYSRPVNLRVVVS